MAKKRTSSSGSNFEGVLYGYTDTHCLADHPELIEELFATRGLSEYFDFYVKDSERYPQDFYHAKAHSFQVALNCFEGGLYSGVSNSEMKVLLVAGLFHDARHSQGTYSDRYNVPTAQDALRVAHQYAPAHHKLSSEELRQAMQAIGCTHYPYVKNVKETLDKIIRDADMMSMYCKNDDVLLPMFKGLIKEINVQREKDMSVAMFCENQATFATGIQWNTQWGKLKSIHKNWPQTSRSLCKKLLEQKAA